MDNILDKYKTLVGFLAEVLGESYEIVLHDLSNFENSIIAIENGHISGRKKGDALTDLALKIVNDENNLKEEYLTNYTGKTKKNKNLRSSTFFIRNDKNKVIGMLCINFDVTKLIYARDMLDKLINGDKKINKITEEKFPEKFTNSIEELMHLIIENSIKEMSIPPKRMTADEKKEIVKKLDNQGVFLLKNSVTEVAKELETSEATIYRYLNN
ncbi:YheO-like PAS domain protein [Iocasia frigidifontis]|uniref:YheO-like PAS domain protein n=1 Tax=Iocasia fonsfrigidae TaxID=2682810 RepID=A0A8A7KA53_9FIRM|nr:PAS domain-containing protein [Iocasia fonsfrigidae]QTL98120.1 YheO-like PAS domain protein [Iocasia fonsfrigidae]